MRLLLSYGHDAHTPLALRLKSDLENHNHEVWIDQSRLIPGADWEGTSKKASTGSPPPHGFSLNEPSTANHGAPSGADPWADPLVRGRPPGRPSRARPALR